MVRFLKRTVTLCIKKSIFLVFNLINKKQIAKNKSSKSKMLQTILAARDSKEILMKHGIPNSQNASKPVNSKARK